MAWTAQIAALEADYHCLAPDLPGHGASAAEPFTIDRAARGVAELIEREAHGGRALLVGLSLGGLVAMDVAARWPDRVSGLAISGATADPAGLHSFAFRAFATILDVVPDPVLASVYRWFFEHRFPSRIVEPILAGGFAFSGSVLALRSLIGERFRPRLAAYPGPSLLINGEYDLFFRPTEQAFAAVARDPRRVVIRRATHLANLDQPERFTAAIRAFADRVALR
jgi:pimeloyl-ACP methyl ester carboxylesterase